MHTWDVDRDAPRSYRLDRMKNSKQMRKRFVRRDGFDRSELHHATTRSHLVLPGRCALGGRGKGATPLVDGSALSERAVGSAEWLIGEVLSFRGAAVVLEPPDLRARVADRARELERQFRLARAKQTAMPAKPA